jgi:hypothetical protein
LINLPNVTSSSDPTALTSSVGQTRWWDLRAKITLRSGGAGATVYLKVNGNDLPIPDGAIYGNVDNTSYPVRLISHEVLLDDSDVVTVHVDGDPVDVDFSATLLSEDV